MKTVHDSLAFRRRGTIGMILLVPIGVAVSFSRPVIPEDSLSDLAMDVLGWTLFIVYITFRLWGTLYVGGRKDKELQTQGPYSMTRNPLYFGSLCFSLSSIFFLKSLSLFLMVCVAGFLYLYGIVQAEERYLESKFGEDFKRYQQRTPRLLPDPSLYESGDSVDVNLRALQSEARRLWASALLPIGAEIISHLRMVPWWPHWFTLP